MDPKKGKELKDFKIRLDLKKERLQGKHKPIKRSNEITPFIHFLSNEVFSNNATYVEIIRALFNTSNNLNQMLIIFDNSVFSFFDTTCLHVARYLVEYIRNNFDPLCSEKAIEQTLLKISEVLKPTTINSFNALTFLEHIVASINEIQNFNKFLFKTFDAGNLFAITLIESFYCMKCGNILFGGDTSQESKYGILIKPNESVVTGLIDKFSPRNSNYICKKCGFICSMKSKITHCANDIIIISDIFNNERVIVHIF